MSVEADDGGLVTRSSCSSGGQLPAGIPVRPDDTERVTAICRALDGMALAIEPAAPNTPPSARTGSKPA